MTQCRWARNSRLQQRPNTPTTTQKWHNVPPILDSPLPATAFAIVHLPLSLGSWPDLSIPPASHPLGSQTPWIGSNFWSTQNFVLPQFYNVLYCIMIRVVPLQAIYIVGKRKVAKHASGTFKQFRWPHIPPVYRRIAATSSKWLAWDQGSEAYGFFMWLCHAVKHPDGRDSKSRRIYLPLGLLKVDLIFVLIVAILPGEIVKLHFVREPRFTACDWFKRSEATNAYPLSTSSYHGQEKVFQITCGRKQCIYPT